MNNNNHDKEILATPARELHQLFAVKTNYNFWIRNMIKRCKLKEDIDFVYDKGELLLLTTNKNNEKREKLRQYLLASSKLTKSCKDKKFISVKEIEWLKENFHVDMPGFYEAFEEELIKFCVENGYEIKHVFL